LYVFLSTLLLGCVEKNLEILGVLLADPLLQSHVTQTQVSSKLKICAGSTPSTLFRKCPKNMQLSSLLTAALDLLMAIDFRKLRSLWRERKVAIQRWVGKLPLKWLPKKPFLSRYTFVK
jgi:hypothetical protein